MGRLDKTALVIIFAMIVASLFFKSVKITFSVFAGTAIAFSSWKAICFIVSHLMNSEKKSKRLVILAAFLKFALLGAVLWYAVNNLSVHILAFLAGLSTMVVAVTFYGLTDLIRGKS
jgi:hypothetical protein